MSHDRTPLDVPRTADSHLHSMTSPVAEDPSKIHGYKDAAVGVVKEKVGGIFSDNMAITGAAQRAHGNAEIEAARGHGLAQARTEQVEGHAREEFGRVTGQPSETLAGKAEKIQGEMREPMHRP